MVACAQIGKPGCPSFFLSIFYIFLSERENSQRIKLKTIKQNGEKKFKHASLCQAGSEKEI